MYPLKKPATQNPVLLLSTSTSCTSIVVLPDSATPLPYCIITRTVADDNVFQCVVKVDGVDSGVNLEEAAKSQYTLTSWTMDAVSVEVLQVQ